MFGFIKAEVVLLETIHKCSKVGFLNTRKNTFSLTLNTKMQYKVNYV